MQSGGKGQRADFGTVNWASYRCPGRSRCCPERPGGVRWIGVPGPLGSAATSCLLPAAPQGVPGVLAFPGGPIVAEETVRAAATVPVFVEAGFRVEDLASLAADGADDDAALDELDGVGPALPAGARIAPAAAGIDFRGRSRRRGCCRWWCCFRRAETSSDRNEQRESNGRKGRLAVSPRTRPEWHFKFSRNRKHQQKNWPKLPPAKTGEAPPQFPAAAPEGLILRWFTRTSASSRLSWRPCRSSWRSSWHPSRSSCSLSW